MVLKELKKLVEDMTNGAELNDVLIGNVDGGSHYRRPCGMLPSLQYECLIQLPPGITLDLYDAIPRPISASGDS